MGDREISRLLRTENGSSQIICAPPANFWWSWSTIYMCQAYKLKLKGI